jgi:sugar phosphate isomerase/epimerase
MNDLSIALQLYTVRDQTAQNFAETLRHVASMGYSGVEFAGYGNLSSQEMLTLLQETQLQAVGTHVSLAAVEQRLDQEIDYCLAIGCPYLIVPGLPEDWYTADKFRILASRMNEIGRRCRQKGISFGFHNHYKEFTSAEGKYLLDILLENTEPAFVIMELDTYWAAYAGCDPITYLQAHTDRVPLVHLKDMTPEHTDTEIGDGILDITGIIRAAQQAGARWFIVEHDQPTIPSLQSAQRSYANLSVMAI